MSSSLLEGRSFCVDHLVGDQEFFVRPGDPRTATRKVKLERAYSSAKAGGPNILDIKSVLCAQQLQARRAPQVGQ